jgi:hypothetical protein
LRVQGYAVTAEIALNVGYRAGSVKQPGAILQGQYLKCHLRVEHI